MADAVAELSTLPDSGIVFLAMNAANAAHFVREKMKAEVPVQNQHGARDYCVVVATTEDHPPGEQFVAPYSAMSIAEHFMQHGRDVLVVLDDLTKHARAYRELSLLLRRPPGREAFPGDVFYIHSRLLERSTRLREELGGGSVTAITPRCCTLFAKLSS